MTRLEDGRLFEHEVEVPADLPRIGVVLMLAPGPRAARVPRPRPVGELLRPPGVSGASADYRSTATDEYVPYIAPQEHGHHGDIRWLRLTREDGTGIEVRGMPTIGFSGQPLHGRRT